MASPALDLTLVTQSFPELTGPIVPRQNFVEAIDTLFQGGMDLVLLEGEGGAGKTTLAAQFAKAHSERAVSLFLRPASRWGYDPLYLRRDICSQIQQALQRPELDADLDVNDGELRRLVYSLQKRARQSPFFFILDGLEEVPPQDEQQRQMILAMLPFGLPGFRFLVSSQAMPTFEPPVGMNCKSFPLAGFTFEETASYLSDLALKREDMQELHALSRGKPGHLASMRRILTSGTDVRSILEQMPAKLPNLFEIEWSNVRAGDQVQALLLAIVAHDRGGTHSEEDLARLAKCSTDEVESALEHLPFLQKTTPSGGVAFVSETFRTFAATKLGGLSRQVQNTLIDDLLRAPSSDAAIIRLPAYYRAAGRLDELVNYLSPDLFSAMLDRCQSLSPLRQTAQLGVNAALERRRDEDLMRFAMHRSVFEELDGADVWHEEVEARMAVDDYPAALSTAQSAALTEDRLQLLAVIARAKREKGLTPEPELLEQIRKLYAQVDKTALGERRKKLAQDLICSLPEIAVEIVEAANAENSGIPADLALATLSIRAEAVERGVTGSSNSSIDAIRSRIKDPSVRHFSSAASIILRGYSARELIEEVEKIDNIEVKMLLLRQWTLRNRLRADAAEVIEYALAAAISAAEYTPNARDMRQICAPLPFATARAQHIIRTLDGLKGSFERYGPTVDYVRLQLLIAEAESKVTFEAARARVVDLHLFAEGLNEEPVRAECMAWLASFLATVDSARSLEKEEGLHTLTESSLRKTVDQILEMTAHHHIACRGVVQALARGRPDLAKEIALSLNTEIRRDLALVDLVEAVLESRAGDLEMALVEGTISAIHEPRLIEDATSAVVRRIEEDFASTGLGVKDVIQFARRVDSMQDATERCRSFCRVYTIVKSQDGETHKDFCKHILSKVEQAWEAIDVGWHRVRTAFEVCAALAKTSLEDARTYLDLGDALKKEVELQAPETAWAFIASVRLAIAALSGLMRRRLEKKEDIDRLDLLISQIPSYGEQALLWGDLAVRYLRANRTDDAKKITFDRVYPLFQRVPEADSKYKTDVFLQLIFVLHRANSVTTREEIKKLSPNLQDEAWSQVAGYILRKEPLFEPYETLPGQAYDISHAEMQEICEILQNIDSDFKIYSIMEKLADTLNADRRKVKYTSEQRQDISKRLEAIADAKFMNPRFIRHEGYKIAAKAQVLRIRDARGQAWTDVIQEARRIHNVADRAYLLILIGGVLPAKESALRPSLISDARALIQAIPSANDRAGRLECLAENLALADRALCQEVLKDGMKEALKVQDESAAEVQRRLIDFAHRLDPDLAASLAAMGDDEPARFERRAMLKREVKVLDARKELVAGKKEGRADAKELPSVAWRSLAAMNANRFPTFGLEQLRGEISTAACLPLSTAYPVLGWAISDVALKYADTPHALQLLRPVFESTLIACQLCARMVSRSVAQAPCIDRQDMAVLPMGSCILIRPGQRAIAIDFLKEWITTSVEEYLKICDPYFGPEDLEIVQWVLALKPDTRVQILTSLKHQRGIEQPLADAYRNYWQLRLSAADPPDTEVFVIGTRQKEEFPIHDRWWLTLRAGIRIGTSFNSLGIGSESEISRLSQGEAEERQLEVDRFLSRTIKEHRGDKILYTVFTL